MFEKKQNSTASPYTQDVGLAFMYSGIVALVALGFLVIYALGQATKIYAFFSILGITTIIAFASFAFGGIIGFLFGIPHSNPNTVVTPTANPSSSTPASSTQSSSNTTSPNTAPILNASSSFNPSSNQQTASHATSNFVQSTNLEQIADWLTKIFVGVGLTQIHKIIRLFSDLCRSLASSIEAMIPQAQHPNATPLIGGIIILFSLIGFLIVYLWTYLYLIKIQDELGRVIIDRIDKKIQSIDANNKLAIDLANTQLDLPQNSPDLPLDELVEAFGNASRNVISAIFFKAVSVRKQNWRKEEDRFRINRAVVIFKALIKLDANFEFPENFAELGYALKDKMPPEYKDALENLNKAIESFKVNKTIDRPITYYNRAYCRIMVDDNFSKEPPSPSDEGNKNLILSDLNEASKEDRVAEIIRKDAVIIKWKTLNNVG